MLKNKENQSKDITRKQALKKMGTYATFAALGTMVMLNPLKAAQPSPPNGFSGGNQNGARGVRRNKNKK
jgi:hypothetical protein